MALPIYQISLINPITGEVVASFDGPSFYEVRYSRALNDVGVFAMTLPSDPETIALFTLDSLIEVARTSPATGQLAVEETYLVRLTHRFREGDQERFIVGGLSLNHLLARRVVDPDDDPAAAGGYSTKAGPADDVLRDYAREQCGDLASAIRQYPNFSVGSVGSVGLSVGRRLRYENLLEIFQDVANQGGVDFLISRITGNTLRLTIAPIGTDKTKTRNYPFAPFVQLDPARGNLSEPSLLFDRREEQNFVYALGQGPGEQRITLKYSGLGIGDSPYNRIEFTSDVRTAERGDSTTLATGARAALFEKQARKEFTFAPVGTEPGAIYQLDYVIGDILTCAWGDESIDLRVRGIDISLSEDGEKLEPLLEPI